jgi:hypothetical protein
MADPVSWLRSEGTRLAGSQHAYGDGEILLGAAAELEKLRAALSWIEGQDPQIVEAARAKFAITSDTSRPSSPEPLKYSAS